MVSCIKKVAKGALGESKGKKSFSHKELGGRIQKSKREVLIRKHYKKDGRIPEARSNMVKARSQKLLEKPKYKALNNLYLQFKTKGRSLFICFPRAK